MSIGSGAHTHAYVWLQSPWWTELRSVICTGHMLRSMLWLQPNGSGTPPPCPPPRSSAPLSSPVQPYLPGLIKLPVRGKGRCRSCGWGVATAPLTDRKRGIMNRVVQKRSVTERERCYNRCGQKPALDSASRLLHWRPLPTPTYPQDTHTCSHMHVYHISTTLPTLFCILLVHSVPHLVPHLSFPLSFILVQSLHIFSSNWHFPFANLFSYRLPASVAKATAMDP